MAIRVDGALLFERQSGVEGGMQQFGSPFCTILSCGKDSVHLEVSIAPTPRVFHNWSTDADSPSKCHFVYGHIWKPQSS